MDFKNCLEFGERLKEAFSALCAIGYNEEGVKERLNLSDIADISWRSIPIYRLERLFLREPLDLAIDIFFLQGSLSSCEVDRLFDVDSQNILKEGGVLQNIDGIWVSSISLYPVGDTFVLSDHAWPKLPHPGVLDVPHNQVMYIGGDSRWLVRSTPKDGFDSMLDLCTGSGIHAVLSAKRAKKVVAVDINKRAVECTALNAMLAGADNVEAICGDLYDGVGSRRFDLIIANPPFVPSPVDALGYRDGGSDGAEVQRGIFEGLAEHLSFGGVAQIVTELGEREGESLIDRLRSWLGGAPFDILILRLRSHSAANYAVSHAQGDDSYGEFLDSVESWYANLSRHGFKSVSSVLITLRWSDYSCGEPWGRIEDVPPPERDISAEIDGIFEAERLTRDKNLFCRLKTEKIKRVDDIGLLEASRLGDSSAVKAQAQRLGAAMPIGRWLDILELNILLSLIVPKNLCELAAALGCDEEVVFEGVKSLIKSGFVTIE